MSGNSLSTNHNDINVDRWTNLGISSSILNSLKLFSLTKLTLDHCDTSMFKFALNFIAWYARLLLCLKTKSGKGQFFNGFSVLMETDNGIKAYKSQ